MFRVFNCLVIEHDLRLVVLAGVVCLGASLLAVTQLQRAREASRRSRALWLALAGLATGFGIWATHFIAMLAYSPPVPVAYSIGLTMLSLVLAAVITCAGLALAVRTGSRLDALLGGATVGGGVAIMHYTGMWALEVPGRVGWNVPLVIASIVLAILFGGAALFVTVQQKTRGHLLLGALLLTLAIVSHHFTAMGAVEISPDPSRDLGVASFSPVALTLVVGCIAATVLLGCLAGALADRRIRERDMRLIDAVNHMPLGLVLFNAREQIVVCNDRYVDLFGVSADVVKPGCTFEKLVAHRKEVGTFVGDVDDYCAKHRHQIQRGKPVRMLAATTAGRSIELTSQPLSDGGWLAIFEDITERKRAEDRILHLAHYDALTGLPNRVMFRDRLEQALNARSNGQRLAVLYLDLDNFKSVNDTLGHPAGDALLKIVATRLQSCLTQADFVARLGGDEFAVIKGEAEDDAAITGLVRQIGRTIGAPLQLDSHQIVSEASIGIALAPEHGNEPDQLLKCADVALYDVKANGRGAFRVFEPAMYERVKARRSMEQDLRQAIERGELELHYQPLVSLRDDKISCCEALVRWRHPTQGMISPLKFIPIAEECGLIAQLGEWALRTACAEAATWPQQIKVAVNVSPAQFRSESFALAVVSALAKSGLPAERLEIEITEDVLIRDDEAALRILHQLQDLGVRIALDDFGTGYSSLSYLQRFAFNKIKIDQCFIKDIAEPDGSLTIVQAIVSIAASRNISTTAEGVETVEQLETLRACGCTEMQGYLFCKPKAASEIRKLFTTKARARTAAA